MDTRGIVCAIPNGFDPWELEGVHFVRGGETRQASVYNALQKIDELRGLNRVPAKQGTSECFERRTEEYPSGVREASHSGPDVQNTVETQFGDMPSSPPNGVQHDMSCYVLIHDAVRPYVSEELVARLWEALSDGRAAVPVVQPVDSVIVNSLYVDRGSVRLVQTPQGFDFDTIYALHRKYAGRGMPDDASLCQLEGIDITFIDGDTKNRKITYRSDLDCALRTGFGFDSHLFSDDPTRKLKLCGICIENHRGLVGVSDADVAVHSIIDAILGALAAGSIGEFFPEASDSSKDADSTEFLKQINNMALAKGFIVSNLDVTIICDSPEIRKYRSRMVSNIARILGINERRVNVKGKTTEGTIVENGIVSMASVLLNSVV
jgi:2-C-methyl-D-erythritol 4-phosphate cytidylyltransferase/2-C-methyl-D-erythritol 2,4-cyclodiphosphate synthase